MEKEKFSIGFFVENFFLDEGNSRGMKMRVKKLSQEN
jgi:hypothetical protein